ncbi:hypothetical protein [Streptomyces sp. x-19]|uniref:hypothetical protein n=1 Tax=Streptomyces sp. x-19 TaxID=2789280 RepID=UPI00397F8C36
MHHTTDALLAPAELIPAELPPAARAFAARKNGCAARGMSRRATGPGRHPRSSAGSVRGARP